MKKLIVLIVLLLNFALPVLVFANDEQNVDVTVNIIPKKSTGSVSYSYDSGSSFAITCEPSYIQDIFITDITYDSAVINWHTNHRCNGRIWIAEYEYYANMYYTEWIEEQLFHEVYINDLTENTKYAYQIIIEDECGIRRSNVLSFCTTKAPGKYVTTEYDVIPDKAEKTIPESNPDKWTDNTLPRSINYGLICIIAGSITLILLLVFIVYKIREKRKINNGNR